MAILTLKSGHPQGQFSIKLDLQLGITQCSHYYRIQFVEAYTNLTKTMEYYSNHSIPFNFLMITNVSRNTNATELQQLTQTYMSALPENAWPNWVVSTLTKFTHAGYRGF